jgi:predicted PilT family ATPase
MRRKASGSDRGRHQLSLAIGKKGQNVRLAAKLLGWKIDIKSEEEKRQEVEQQMIEAHSGHHRMLNHCQCQEVAMSD